MTTFTVVDGAVINITPDSVLVYTFTDPVPAVSSVSAKLSVDSNIVALESDINTTLSTVVLSDIGGAVTPQTVGTAAFNSLVMSALSTVLTKDSTAIVLDNSTFTLTFIVTTQPIIPNPSPPPTNIPDPTLPVSTIFTVNTAFASAGQTKLKA